MSFFVVYVCDVSGAGHPHPTDLIASPSPMARYQLKTATTKNMDTVTNTEPHSPRYVEQKPWKSL